MVFHGKQTDGADGYEGGNHRYVETHAKIAEAPVDETADNTSHRINLLAENHRLLIQENIADDASERTRDATHDDGYPERETAIEGLLDSGYVEKRQTQGVEKKPGIVQTLQIMMAQDDHQLCQQREEQIDRTRHPERSLT